MNSGTVAISIYFCLTDLGQSRAFMLGGETFFLHLACSELIAFWGQQAPVFAKVW